MGIRSAWRVKQSIGPGGALLSPWSEDTLAKVVWSDVFGTQPVAISRQECMSLSAVVKGRAVLMGQIARWPLIALDANSDQKANRQPAWLQATDGDLSPWHRMMLTVDDLIFYGYALWLVERDATGAITKAEHCPQGDWKFNDDGEVVVVETVLREDEFLLIPGPFEGLLAIASRTVRGGISMERAWVGKAQNPIPAIDLHRNNDDLTAEEVTEVVEAWAAARQGEHGMIASTPDSIDARELGTTDPQLYVEGRNAFRLDIAGFLAIPGSIMDASTATASLTYVTQEGKRSEFADFTLPYWMDPIAARLSMDDVVPAGSRVRFDLSDAFAVTPAPAGPTTGD